ncbi:MAG: hypothetical protein QN204_11055 [Armatimonadota bacterium]|nr:hypothetical protein [Armatimonadota bacterium]MDR7462952.1 hypothetical protein [Armatimonadota bacterium]
MESLVLLLLLLACPVGMGVGVWLGARRGSQPSPTPLPDAPVLHARADLHEQPAAEPDTAAQARPFRFLWLDWRLVGSVALAGVLLWRVAPQLLPPAVILLLLLACPVSHYLLMRGAPGASCRSAPQDRWAAQRVRTRPAGGGEEGFGTRGHTGGQRGG